MVKLFLQPSATLKGLVLAVSVCIDLVFAEIATILVVTDIVSLGKRHAFLSALLFFFDTK